MNLSEPFIQLQVNGDPRAVPAGQRLFDLVAGLGLPPQAALVEHNGRALLRAEWEQISLMEGDKLEILRVVAGG